MRATSALKFRRIPLNPRPATPDTHVMQRRATIAELSASGFLALMGVAALFSLMLQFIYPAESWPAWTAGSCSVAGVLGMMVFASVASRAQKRAEDLAPLATIRPAAAPDQRKAA